MQRLTGRAAQVGGASLVRLLPSAGCRKVGPWVFLDHFGPAVVNAIDVLPHPHCGLSTVSYLFEGAMVHRDSLGSHVRVEPGEVHWMRAGHGIVHSERTPPDLVGPRPSHGLQLWCAHPDGEEEQEPAFGSWRDLPELDLDGVRVQLLAGNGWGAVSPVEVTSNLVYAIAHLPKGSRLRLPDHVERCVTPVRGRVGVEGEGLSLHEVLVVARSATELVADTDATVVLLGGDPIGTRHMWWNLVHSDPERLRAQANRWRDRGFPKIPGDATASMLAPSAP